MKRVFQSPFSWQSLGIRIRGRSKSLKINYRTSHQIRQKADILVDEELADVDGYEEDRKGTVSVFNGPHPEIRELEDAEEEQQKVAEFIQSCSQNGILSHETGIFVRTEEQLARAQEAVKRAGFQFKLLDAETEPQEGYIALSTMHLAKGLEFKCVVVMACDDEVLPLKQRTEGVGDEVNLEDIQNTERNLLYVACTRARDYLLVTGTDPASEFLDDLG